MKLKTRAIGLWIFLLFSTWLAYHLSQEFKIIDILYLPLGGIITFAVSTWYDKKKLENERQKLTEVVI